MTNIACVFLRVGTVNLYASDGQTCSGKKTNTLQFIRVMLSAQEKQLFDLEPSTAPAPAPTASNPVQTAGGSVETDAILATMHRDGAPSRFRVSSDVATTTQRPLYI